VNDRKALWEWFGRLGLADRVRATTTVQDSHAVAALLDAHARTRPRTTRAASHAPLMFDWDDASGEYVVSTFPRLDALALEDATASEAGPSAPRCCKAAADARAALAAALRITWANGPADPYATPDIVFLHPCILASARSFHRIMVSAG
jgi:hypothetical protein